MNQPEDLADELRRTFRRMAGWPPIGAWLPETWDAVAQTAREFLAREQAKGDANGKSNDQ